MGLKPTIASARIRPPTPRALPLFFGEARAALEVVSVRLQLLVSVPSSSGKRARPTSLEYAAPTSRFQSPLLRGSARGLLHFWRRVHNDVFQSPLLRGSARGHLMVRSIF